VNKTKSSQPLSWDNDVNSENDQMDDEQCEKSTSEKADVIPNKSTKIAKIGQKRDAAGS
jgi:hypothetical protein